MGEKNQEPTAKRLRKARDDGNVPRSADFGGAAVLVAATAALWSWGPAAVSRWVEWVTSLLKDLPEDPHEVPYLVGESLEVAAFMVAPVLGSALVIGSLVAYLQVGSVFSFKAVLPDASRMNPADGLKRLFGKDKVVRLGQNLMTLGIVGTVAVAGFHAQLLQTVATLFLDVEEGSRLLVQQLRDASSDVIACILALGVADLAWQRHKHRKSLMMSLEEVKNEYKEAEGDPQMKAQRKRLHQELLRGGSLRRVKDADAVVVNPTHVAAAISYDPESGRAPVVVAKGEGNQAARIRRLARAHDVPVVRDVALARALREVDLEDEIPEDLYNAVAEVLHFVYQLSGEVT